MCPEDLHFLQFPSDADPPGLEAILGEMLVSGRRHAGNWDAHGSGAILALGKSLKP